MAGAEYPSGVALAECACAAGVSCGGFAAGHPAMEVALGERPVLIRAMNVLRQYDEAEVPAAWSRAAARLAPGGLLVDGTCDELGRTFPGNWRLRT